MGIMVAQNLISLGESNKLVTIHRKVTSSCLIFFYILHNQHVNWKETKTTTSHLPWNIMKMAKCHVRSKYSFVQVNFEKNYLKDWLKTNREICERSRLDCILTIKICHEKIKRLNSALWCTYWAMLLTLHFILDYYLARIILKITWEASCF